MISVKVVLIYLVLKVFLETVIGLGNDNTDEEKICMELLNMYNDYYDESYKQNTVIHFIENYRLNYIVNVLSKHIHDNSKTFSLTSDRGFGDVKLDRSISIGHVDFIYIYLYKSFWFISDVLDGLKGSIIWKPRARYVVIFKEPIEENKIMDVFSLFWTRKILNAVVVAFVNGRVETIGFNPFHKNYYEPLHNKNIFYNKLRDLNGHILNVFLTREEDKTTIIIRKSLNQTTYSGKDGSLMTTIKERINATFRVISLSELYGAENPWRTLNKGSLEHRKQQIIDEFNADFFMDAQELFVNNFTEFLYPHARDDLVIVVPAAKLMPKYRQLIYVFAGGFVYFIISFVLICPLVWCLLNWVRSRICLTKNKFVLTFLNNLRLVLGFGLHRIEENFTENLLIIFLLFCNLIVNSYFQSTLSSIMTVSGHEKEIETFQDIIDDCKSIFTYKYVIEQADEILKITGHTKMKSRFVLFSAQHIFLPYKKLPIGCGTTNYDHAELLLIIRHDFRLIKDHLIPSFQAYQAIRDSPYYDMLDEYIRRIMESGLYGFWKRLSQLDALRDVGGPEEPEYNGYKDMSLDEMKGCFYVLLVGLFLAIIVLIGEIIWYHSRAVFHKKNIM